MPSRLTDAFRAHPVHLHQKLLDFTSLQELPDSYKWTQPDEHPSCDSFITESVPVIDLLDPNALQKIGHACKTWGVLQVTNHGIPTGLLDKIESASKSLFSLPIEQKLKAARSPDGFTGYGLARISSFFSKLMWYEGFTIVGSPLEHFRHLWPQDYIKFRYLCIRMHVLNFITLWFSCIYFVYADITFVAKTHIPFTFLNAISKDNNESHGPTDMIWSDGIKKQNPLVAVCFCFISITIASSLFDTVF